LAEKLGENPPSYWLVYRIVRELPADLVMLAHKGTKSYSDTFELIHRREAAGPNAIWQADHTPLDILLIRPDGEFAKPWLTVVIDDYSRAIAGYFLSFEDPSALHSSLALRQAIWRKEDPRWIVCGVPDILTILDRVGLPSEALSYLHNGRSERLTDFGGTASDSLWR
jgi:putative transposase